jgi:hypothetical protein
VESSSFPAVDLLRLMKRPPLFAAKRWLLGLAVCALGPNARAACLFNVASGFVATSLHCTNTTYTGVTRTVSRGIVTMAVGLSNPPALGFVHNASPFPKTFAYKWRWLSEKELQRDFPMLCAR